VLLESEPAWTTFLGELHGFLGGASAPDLKDLTAAEREVFALLAEGLDNRDIAARLEKNEKTVRNQVSAILGKLDLRSRAQAIVYAQQRRES
jgi:DNA-binding NarL/FixJ family response regulator